MKYLSLGLVTILAMTGAFSAAAATPGGDDASQAVYMANGAPLWASGMNGGKGFTGWNLVTSDTSGASGFFVGDSKNLAGGSGADINAGGKSWGLFGKGKGHSANAYRSFDAPLAVGQGFAVDIAVNFRNGQKGFDLRNAADEQTIFNLNVGSDDYVVNAAATGNGSMGSNYDSNTSFHLSFTQTDAAGGTWTLTRGGGAAKTASGTYSGIPGSIKFYVMETDDGSENDLMVNNLSITSAAGAAVPAAAASSPKLPDKP